MKSYSKDNRCGGCGAVFQTEKIDNPGYISKQNLGRKDILCKRCFDLKHYSKDKRVIVNALDGEKTLEKIANDNGFVINILDAIDLDGSIISFINNYIKKENLVILVNKVDLFDEGINFIKLEENIRNYLTKQGISYLNLFLISGKNSDEVASFTGYLKNNVPKNQNIYFVGSTNVGKSTIVNNLLNHLESKEQKVTVSNSFNTTLDFIEFSDPDLGVFFDTPGIVSDDNLIYYLEKTSYKYISPRKFLRPKVYQTSKGNTYFLSGIARIEIAESEKLSLIFYCSKDILIHRCKTINQDNFYQNHLDDLLKVPNKKERENLGRIIEKEHIITGKVDFAIKGVGFFTVTGKGKIKISSFEKIKIIRKEALI